MTNTSSYIVSHVFLLVMPCPIFGYCLQDEIRSQDTVFAIAGVTGSAEGRELAWNFVRANWTELHERYKGGFLLARLVKVR